MFKEFSGKPRIKDLEESVLKFWHDQDIFHKSIALRKDRPVHIFYEGPPTANGKPGIHHILSRTIKDVVNRYKTMKGFQVPRKAGWDTHGLPVEIAVEKMLGLTQKNEIEVYGVAKFNDACRNLVEEHINMADGWRTLTDRMGYWLDLDNAYVTYKNEYIESVWWAIKTIFDKGLIYRDFKIVPQSPTIETPLSSHELSLGYKDVRDPNLYIKVKVLASPHASLTGADLLIWTTTPWTLISNVAAACGEDIDYVLVENRRQIKHGDSKEQLTDRLILAEARLAALDGETEILERFKGSKLVGTRYEQIFSYLPIDLDEYPNALTVVAGDFVSTEDGSGIVHMAPAFGQDDYDMSKVHNLPVLQPITPGGKFTDAVSTYAGRPVKTFTYQDGHVEEGVDKDVIIELKVMNKVYRATNDYLHSYPHCWRTDNPVVYYARESWFINSPAYKDRLVALNKTINWQPPEIGAGRFGNWLEDVKEWSLSRDRYWGTPLPLWLSEDGQDIIAIGSIEALKEGIYVDPESGERTAVADLETLDLHRPFVDHIIFEKNGQTYRRTPEIIDVWFDSGAMPFAQFHYPFENKDLFEKSFPADFIAEGVDQTRGWFYTLHNIATVLFDKPAFKNIIVNDMVLDKDGSKMSKSKANVVYPYDIINSQGVDPLRWYLMTMNNPWLPKRFDIKGIEEVSRKFFDTLINSYSFFALYANIDRFDPQSPAVPVDQRPEIDRWIISRLYTIVERVTDRMEAYDLMVSARTIADFLVDDVSNWYVRRNRRRFWKSEDSADKKAAYHTLYEVLVAICQMSAPFAPFISDAVYRHLRTGDMPESVHLTDFPGVDDAKHRAQNSDLEYQMSIAQQVVKAARALRNETRIRVRQPLQEVAVSSAVGAAMAAVEQMAHIIREEINVKEVTLVAQTGDLVHRSAKADFKKLGPRFGKQMKQVAALIQEFGEDEIGQLETGGQISVEIDGQSQTLMAEEVLILSEQKGEMAVAREGVLTIGLNTHISPELEREGIAREFINRIQNLRRDADLEVVDRIAIFYEASEKVNAAIRQLSDYIQAETLAVDMVENVPADGDTQEISIDTETLKIQIKRVNI